METETLGTFQESQLHDIEREERENQMREIKFATMEIENIANWMKNYVKGSGSKGYVVGLSGGVDSAVVAALAVKAVGVENVQGVIMPIESSPEDQKDAILVAETLGIRYDILDMYEMFEGMKNAYPYTVWNDNVFIGNIKARLRMTMLYQYAGEMDYLVAGTGNKSEDSIGYFTKYGDGGVDILPIVEYYKTEIRQLARVLGMPQIIWDRVSTAGLYEGQTDEKDLGMSYDVIDSILYYLDTGKEYPIRHADKIEVVKKLITRNKHKNEYPPNYRR